MRTGNEDPKRSTERHALLEIPGHAYFALTRAKRSECEVTSIARLSRLGNKAPRCYKYLGKTLALLDQIACCVWGCPETEEGHVLHRLIGRGVSNGNAGVQLALTGQYDESLASARAIGEIANLLWLFSIDHQTLEKWQSLEPRVRWSTFRPAEVRKKIEAKGQPLLVQESEYRLLSEHGVHVTPTTSPNTVGFHDRPSLGGVYREDAFLVCINEIAWAVGVLSLPSVNLLGSGNGARMIRKTTRTLLQNVGGARISQIPEISTSTGTRSS